MSIQIRKRNLHGVETLNYVVRIYNNGERKEFSFSEHRLGKYAKELAHLSEKEGKRVETLVERKRDYSIMKLYSKTFGYIDVKIDNDDIEKVRYNTWMVSKRLTGSGYYIRNNSLGRLHRYLLNIDRDDILIDHINRDTLDNRKSNLRLVSHEINMKNINIQSNNKSSITGVRYSSKQDYWIAQINIKGKQTTKSFSCKKYGNEKAKNLAIEWRVKKEQENGYLGESNCNVQRLSESNENCE